MVQNDNFLVKNRKFICEFKIHGSKRRNVFTANKEGNLHIQFFFNVFLQISHRFLYNLNQLHPQTPKLPHESL